MTVTPAGQATSSCTNGIVNDLSNSILQTLAHGFRHFALLPFSIDSLGNYLIIRDLKTLAWERRSVRPAFGPPGPLPASLSIRLTRGHSPSPLATWMASPGRAFNSSTMGPLVAVQYDVGSQIAQPGDVGALAGQFGESGPVRNCKSGEVFFRKVKRPLCIYI
jgi:hypothetical protein